MNINIKTRFSFELQKDLKLSTARLVVLNWAYAKKRDGKFFAIFSGNDAENEIDNIYQDLIWLGIKFDIPDIIKGKGGLPGIVYQSARRDVYINYVNELINKGFAYKCNQDGKKIDDWNCYERIKQWAGYGNSIVKLDIKAITQSNITLDDLQLGKKCRNLNEIEDFVILDCNKVASKDLRSTVDDIEMEITHVIEDLENLNSTFRRILLFKAFNKNPPLYAHISLCVIPRDNLDIKNIRGCLYCSDITFDYLLNPNGNISSNRLVDINSSVESFDPQNMGSYWTKISLGGLTYRQTIKINNLSKQDKVAKILECNNFSCDKNKVIKFIDLCENEIRSQADIIRNSHIWNAEDFKVKEDFEIKDLVKNELLYFNKIIKIYGGPWKVASIKVLINSAITGQTLMYDQLNKESLTGVDSYLIFTLGVLITGAYSSTNVLEKMEILGQDICEERIDKYMKIKYNDKL